MAMATNMAAKNDTTPANFSAMRVQLASSERIRSWSYGEVTKPETINYRSFKPENDGLFCQRIFGPVKDFECACGKYKGSRFKGVVCDRCGVEVTHSRVRRERMGHIELAVPVAHIWYVRTNPSRIGTLLNLSYSQLDQIIYYEAYVVTDPGSTEVTGLKYKQILTDGEYRELKLKGVQFEALMGAAAFKKLLSQIKLDELAAEIRSRINVEKSEQQKKTLLKRLTVVEAFRQSDNKPEWMVVDVIPVLPPDLRPLIPLEGGRFATSDLNDLYRRLINRNNRLKKLLEIQAPEVILRNEKRMLQEAVDALIQNGKVTTAVRGQNRRPLKSLSDFLRGKQGRFRQNLLGKRVDYSGRAVIVVNPELKIWQCGLPKTMALELFKPFIIRKLEEKGITQTIRGAKKFVERGKSEIWDLLEEIIKNHPVALNRAPTLHRLSIQSFYPILVEGKAIQIHPLVCAAFNADFDGDQMAVHVPLSFEAQIEAHLLMISANNILQPSNGQPVAAPSQDMVLGAYYMTKERPGGPYEGKVFSSMREVLIARDHGKVDVHSKIFVRMPAQEEHLVAYKFLQVKKGELLARIPRCPIYEATEDGKRKRILRTQDIFAPADGEISGVKIGTHIDEFTKIFLETEAGESIELIVPHAFVATTPGRVLFNQIVPPELGYRNRLLKKNTIKDLISESFDKVGLKRTAVFLDEIKRFGFDAATNGSISIGMDDLLTPPTKPTIIAEARKEIRKIQDMRKKGVITDKERYNNVINIWSKSQEAITEALFEVLAVHNYGFNPLSMMVDSGARGSQDQIRQLSGLRGLMSKPQKKMTSQSIIETPILSSFREGLSVVEYFTSSHGQRKGLADTALKTAEAGYLTRRLVDVAQDVIISEPDCGTIRGIVRHALKDGEKIIIPLRDRISGRYAAEDIYDPVTGDILVEAYEYISKEMARKIEDTGIEEVRIRSVLTCESKVGVCAKCYGVDLSSRDEVCIGEAVGIIAGESIGEPGTQLTLRTFHIGGIAATGTEQSRVTAKFNGTVMFSHLKVVKAHPNDIYGVVLNRTGSIIIVDEQEIHHKEEVPYGARLHVEHMQQIAKGGLLFEWDPYINPMLTDFGGTIEFVDMREDVTVKEMVDEATMTKELVVVDAREKKLVPRIFIKDGENILATYHLPLEAHVLVEDGEQVVPGQIIAKLMRSILRTRDITSGLPRVTELFETRKPKDPAIIAEIDGMVRFMKDDSTKGFRIVINGDMGEVRDYLIPRGRHILVQDNDHVDAGQKLCDGPIIPHDILRIRGDQAVMEYLLNEVQQVYSLQGVMTNDKHYEVIIRQMLRKVQIIDGGDSRFLKGEQADRTTVLAENMRVMAQGGKPATFETLLLGITRASLSTESFISAASFQETVRVLTESVINGKVDKLEGLKENVIIGRLIPAGTGFRKYQKIRPQAPVLSEEDEVDFMNENFIVVSPEELEESQMMPV